MTHSIPHAHTQRPDTGVSNAQLGMWLFLASDAMLMASLLSGHVLLRASAPSVPHLASSWTYLLIEAALLAATLLGLRRVSSQASGRTSDRASGGHHSGTGGSASSGGHHFSGAGGAGRPLLLVCGLLALLCALAQAAEVVGRANAGARPADHVLIASWFTLTVAHMLHVVAGAVAIAWIARQLGGGASPRFLARLHAVRLYWYLVVATWILLIITFGF